MDPIIDPNNPVQDIDEVHGQLLKGLFHNYRYVYAGGMMTTLFSPAVNRDVGTSENHDDKADGREVVKASCSMFLVFR